MKKTTSTIIACLMFWSSAHLMAQNGPGGIGDTTGTTHLKLWLKSDVGVNTSNGQVSSWADQSGNNNNVSNNTTSGRPSFQSTGANNKPYLTFDGVDDCLQTPNTSADFSSTEASIFIVGEGRMNNTVISIAQTSIVQEMLVRGHSLFHHSSSGNFRTRAHQCSNNIPNGDARILTAIFGTTPADIALSFNGLLSNDPITSAGTRGIDFSNVNRSVRIGCRSLGEYLNGNLYEVIVYDRKLTASEQDAVEEYLRCKYDVENNTCGTLSTAPCGTTSIDPISTVQQLQLFPNPANNDLTILAENTTLRRVDLISITGRVLKSVAVYGQQHTLDISDLPAGVYFLRSEDDQQVQSIQKFVKQ